MKLAHSYSAVIDQTLDQMVTLSDLCCTPQVILYADGKIIETKEAVWSSTEAKASFDFLTARLKRLCEEQHRIMNQENTQNEP